jgi:hypothetical protein
MYVNVSSPEWGKEKKIIMQAVNPLKIWQSSNIT